MVASNESVGAIVENLGFLGKIRENSSLCMWKRRIFLANEDKFFYFTTDDVHIMTRKMKLIALLEVDKINIMSPHGLHMKLLVQNGFASKKYMADFFTPNRVKL